MKKQLLLSTLLGVATVFSMTQGAFATSMDVSASLGTIKSITVGGGTRITTIDGTSGGLAAPLTPTFNIYSNTTTGNLSFKATVDTGAATNALSSQGGSYYIALGNTTNKPTAANVAAALASTVTANPNVVAYTINNPTTTSVAGGTMTFTWDAVNNNGWNSTGGVADTYTTNSQINQTARPSTYETALDTSGDYAATLMLTFS